MIDTNIGVGIFLMITGLAVLVPVLLQIRDGTYHWREIWGMFVLAAGFEIVGIAFAFLRGEDQRFLSLTGLGAVLFGLLVQHKRRERSDGR